MVRFGFYFLVFKGGEGFMLEYLLSFFPPHGARCGAGDAAYHNKIWGDTAVVNAGGVGRETEARGGVCIPILIWEPPEPLQDGGETISAHPNSSQPLLEHNLGCGVWGSSRPRAPCDPP